MKVLYEDPDGRAGTYHPQLGYLESGKPFDLPSDQARLYIGSGLLKRAEPPKGTKEVKNGHTDNRP